MREKCSKIKEIRRREIKGRKETTAAKANKAPGKSGVGGIFKGRQGL